MADIKNKIYEAGLFRDGEKIVLTSDNCVLLEYYTGKTYSYRMVDITTLKAKRLFSKANPLNETGYQKAIEKTIGVGSQANSATQSTYEERAKELLSNIFTEVFPQHNMAVRNNQQMLSLEMLIGLQEGKLALCEAEVRTGKTHACDVRVKTYQSSILHNERNEDLELLDILSKLYTGGCSIDLDGLPLSDYVKERICVTDCHRGCPCSAICRYRSFTRNCLLGNYDFQITNHNMVLADILSKKSGRQGLFPNSGAIIFDEAHKLLNAARQMYGMNFESAELERLSGSLLRAIGNRNPDKLSIIRLCEELLDYSQHIHWIELTGVLVCRICSLPKQLDFLLHEDIWSKDTPYILTSGTLSVGGDFTHFKRRNEIAMVENGRLFEASKASPFDYQENALLYLPKDMPLPQSKESRYLQAVVNRLAELIAITHGHSLILFTSYRQMEQAYTALQGMITDYPLFMMGKGRLDALDAFRKSGNGVLLASDSAGEGIDLAGDILSSLIVVRLPFPVPDPVLEYEKSLYSNFYSYLDEIIVPEMLTKLRQWIGRGIRRETDTCVFTILDSRASKHYKNDILAALPDMPVTDQLSDVGRFLLSKKDGSYFE